jgi:hemoglobin
MNRILLPLAASCALLMGHLPARAQSAASAAATAPADDALFRALGGQAGIDAIVDDFVPRLAADPRTGEFFRKADQAHLKAMLSQQFCAVSGGACVYTGLPMKKAHTDMDIAKADFNALVEVLQASMAAQDVAFATQNRLLARLAPMHRDIVNVH